MVIPIKETQYKIAILKAAMRKQAGRAARHNKQVRRGVFEEANTENGYFN